LNNRDQRTEHNPGQGPSSPYIVITGLPGVPVTSYG
jgi:hypothetical protein